MIGRLWTTIGIWIWLLLILTVLLFCFFFYSIRFSFNFDNAEAKFCNCFQTGFLLKNTQNRVYSFQVLMFFFFCSLAGFFVWLFFRRTFFLSFFLFCRRFVFSKWDLWYPLDIIIQYIDSQSAFIRSLCFLYFTLYLVNISLSSIVYKMLTHFEWNSLICGIA